GWRIGSVLDFQAEVYGSIPTATSFSSNLTQNADSNDKTIADAETTEFSQDDVNMTSANISIEEIYVTEINELAQDDVITYANVTETTEFSQDSVIICPACKEKN
ncbi:hypothetical protein Bhyg_03175, partial [Pseudolycoriella hygida]